MSLYVIEQNIPIPPRGSHGRTPKYPFSSMKKGDAFYAPRVKAADLRHASAYWQKKLGHKYTVRADGNGARVWRVK